MSNNNINASQLAYNLPKTTQEQLETLAEIMNLPHSFIENGGVKEVDAMSATILYRHLDRHQKIEAMSIIHQLDNKRLAGKLIELAVDTTFVNPQWGIWSLSNTELQADQNFHATINRYAALIGLSASAMAGKDLIKDAWKNRKLGKGGIATLAIWGILYVNDSELNKANQEIGRRTTLNTSPYYRE